MDVAETARDSTADQAPGQAPDEQGGQEQRSPVRVVIAKPGLDGHDRGAKVVARALRDAGVEVVYTGLHQTPEQIVAAALEQKVHVVGLSILSGSHVPLVRDVLERMKSEGAGDIPVVIGGIIPPEDAELLKGLGVAGVYTPRNFELNAIMSDIVGLVERGAG